MDDTLDLEVRERELEQELAAIRRLRPKPVIYPTWRYHATEAPRIVKSPYEDQALGEGWADAPFEANAPAAPPPAPAMTPSRPVETDPEEARLAQELHKATVEQIVAALPEVHDPDEVQRMLARERRNPKHTGGRKTIVQAIEGRLEDLQRAARSATV